MTETPPMPMRRLRNHLIGIDQGAVMMFSDFADSGPMWSGDGPREVRRGVTFSEPFKAPPVIVTGLSLLDVDSSANLRLDLTHAEVTTEGALLVLRTWGDSRIARIRAAWTAIGEVSGPDEWDLY